MSSLDRALCRVGDATSGLLAVTGALLAGALLSSDRERAGGWTVEGAEVDVGHTPVEADGLVRHGEGQGDGVVGVDEAELAGRDGSASLAAAVDGVEGRGLCSRADGDAEVDVAQIADRAGELELGGVVA